MRQRTGCIPSRQFSARHCNLRDILSVEIQEEQDNKSGLMHQVKIMPMQRPFLNVLFQTEQAADPRQDRVGNQTPEEPVQGGHQTRC